jgi:hypothetical protein
MIENSQQLGEFLQAEARQRRLRLTFDTHSDARNWMLSWWDGRYRHRLDFQPMAEQGLDIIHYKDHIPWVPRMMARLLDAAGPFSELARTDCTPPERGRFPLEEERVQSLITRCLKPPRSEDDPRNRSGGPGKT